MRQLSDPALGSIRGQEGCVSGFSAFTRFYAGRAIKYTGEHYRKDGVSEEDFMRWFTTQFLPRAVPIIKKHNILRCAFQEADPKLGAALQADLDQMRPAWKVNDCDIILEYWFDDLESMESLLFDPQWTQTALKDWNDWLDVSRSTIRISYDTTFLEHGAIKNVTGLKRRSRCTARFD
ncbi:uncharacterized protein LY79DRAFT_584214 [Colletotrichum navitas]|uniref:EthD domain-containing protein n=1 Tax=Colletotrichum navitas TaxID=681940 RepID=A0AAD8PN31_9PEZI|nr:uncharacterized protein LY79DRAFT_584214 [Colletotrichum navitas]KAK1570173.1 hypothetical protein LY79DRAFT_584214 [Colletotrichum navitas]